MKSGDALYHMEMLRAMEKCFVLNEDTSCTMRKCFMQFGDDSCNEEMWRLFRDKA